MNTNNTVKKALSFVKGLTNSPSDFISSDDELTESAGMIMKNGEMVPIQKPALMGTMDAKLVFVHKLADVERYIFYNEQDNSVICSELVKDVFKPVNTFIIKGRITDISAVSAMVVIATTEGVAYLHLKDGTYKFFQGEIPQPTLKISFRRLNNTNDMTNLFKDYDRTLCEMKDVVTEGDKVVADYGPDGAFIEHTTEETTIQYTGEYYPIYVRADSEHGQKDFDDTVQGHVAQTINWTKKNGMFAFPFFLRYALKMYDGSYLCISPPILCMPTNNRNFRMSPAEWDATTRKYKFRYDVNEWGPSRMYDIECYELLYNITFPEIDFWKDLIVGVTIFATEQVLPFYLTEGYKIQQPHDISGDVYANSGYASRFEEKYFNFYYHTFRAQSQIQPDYKSDKKFIEELTASSQFYKLFDILLDECDGITHYTITPTEGKDEIKIREGLLSTLAQQEQLANDDYYGWTTKTPEHLFVYNKRLNMIGVKRNPQFIGNYQLVAGSPGDQYGAEARVHIVSELVDTWVVADCAIGVWFYYPDPNAKEMVFMNVRRDISYPEGMKYAYKRVKLKPHPYLNGAFFFNAFPSKDDDFYTPNEYYPKKLEFDMGKVEYLDSQIFTSVVNNPFVFQADGDNTVGTGSILNVAANTEPISQGQFGQYPLIVFTTEGIYALSVNAEGLYASSYPMSREVCNNAESITPTDRLVFFTSEKGLMVISGGAVQCVSTQLSGPTPNAFKVIGDGDFRKFLANCRIAYDYRESLLRIYSSDYIYHYVYNIADQTFAKAENEENTLLAVASSYPDSLVQEVGGKVYSMLAKPDINADQRTYSGTFITRPLKLGSSLELKTIRQILHFFNSNKGTMKLRIFGSNDCRTWRELKSIHGKPWLFYTLQYDLSNLRASDSFAGTVLAVETRFNDKMR